MIKCLTEKNRQIKRTATKILTKERKEQKDDNEKNVQNDVANFCQSKIDLSTFNKLKKSNLSKKKKNQIITLFQILTSVQFYFIFCNIFY
jgi:hypothetical protein